MNHHPPAECGIIVLAAGASTRLGLPKQLLSFRGTSLIRHVISAAVESQAGPVVVVLGAGHPHIAKEIGERKDVLVVVNPRWQDGVASSIRSGLRALSRIADCERVILAACDQPFISGSLLNSLVDRQAEGGKAIVASCYQHTAGMPALFHRNLFDKLLSLRGDDGAGRVIRKNLKKVATVAFPGGEVDIDTPAAYDAIPRELRRANVVTAAAEKAIVPANTGIRAYSPATADGGAVEVATPQTANQPAAA